MPTWLNSISQLSVLKTSPGSMLIATALFPAMHREPKAWWGRVPTEMLNTVCNAGLLTNAAPMYEAQLTGKEDGKQEHCVTAKVGSLRCVQFAALQAILQYLSQLKLIWGLPDCLLTCYFWQTVTAISRRRTPDSASCSRPAGFCG